VTHYRDTRIGQGGTRAESGTWGAWCHAPGVTLGRRQQVARFRSPPGRMAWPRN